MNQQQIEEWIAKNGGPGAVQYSHLTHEVDNPAADPLTAKAAGVAFNVAAPSKVQIHEEKWTAVDGRGQPTGAELHVKRRPDGDFDIINQSNPTPNRPQTTGTKPPIPPGGKSETEGTPDPSKPGGWDNARPRQVIKDGAGNVVWSEELSGTDLTAWRANQQANQPGSKEEPVPNRPGWVQITTAQGNSSAVKFRGPDGKVVDALPLAPITAKPEQDASGAWGYWDAQPGQQPTWKPISGGPAGKKYTEVKQDPNTGGWSGLTADGKWEAIQGGPGVAGGFAAEPAGAPPLDTTYGAVTASLGKYRDFLNEQVNLYTKSGGTQGIPAAQADKLMGSRLAQAEASIKESQGVIDTQRGIQNTGVTQRGQTLTDTQGRRSAADSTFSTVMGQFMPLLKYLPPGSGETFMKGMQEMLGLGQKNAESWGGQQVTPEVPLGPAAAAANRALPPPGSFLSPYQPTVPPAAPNGAAIAPVAAGVTATNAAAMNPTGATVDAANQATQAGFGAAVAPLLPPPPPVSPLPGQPGSDPNAPIGMAPPQPDQGGTFLDAYGRPQPHPDSELARLLNDPWINNSIVAQAYHETYGQPMPYAVPA